MYNLGEEYILTNDQGCINSYPFNLIPMRLILSRINQSLKNIEDEK